MNQISIDRDVMSMLKSQSFTQYNKIKLFATKSEFYNCELNWETTKLIQQLRTGVPHLKFNGKSIILNSMWKRWSSKVPKNINCELCGKSEENLYHVMFICVHYKPPRLKYLKNDCTTSF